MVVRSPLPAGTFAMADAIEGGHSVKTILEDLFPREGCNDLAVITDSPQF